MMHRKAIHLFVILSLLLRPDTFLYAKEIKDGELDALLNEHKEMLAGQFAADAIDKNGENLINLTFKYLNQPKNIEALKSAKGQDLIRSQKLLSNYLAVKKHLDRCVKKEINKKNLDQRILSASLTAISKNGDLTAPCLPKNNFIKSFTDFNNQVVKALKVRTSADFIQDLDKKLLINSMKSLIGMKYKFDPTFLKTGTLNQNELNQLMSEICYKNSCAKISPQFPREISSEAIKYANSLKATEKKMSIEDSVNSLNATIDRLNRKLNQITVKKDEGIIFDSANFNDPKTKTQFDEYLQTYMQEVSKEAGPLLLTKTMREKAGEIKSLNEDDTKKDSKSKQFKFIPHQKIKSEDFKAAYNEAIGKIARSAKDVEQIIAKENLRKNSKRFEYSNDQKKDLAELIKINPLAAGQVIVQHPEYTGLLCDSINQINNQILKDEEFDKYFMVGGAIVGGALLLTGVGTMAGAYLLTGSLTAGVAAGTVGGTILSSTVMAGAVVETATGAYYGKKAYDEYLESNKIEMALLSNNADGLSIIEKKEAYLSFKDARTKASIAFIGAGLSAIRLERFFDLARMSKASFNITEMKAMTKIFETLNDNRVVTKIADLAMQLGKNAGNLLDEFFLRLAKVSEKTRISLLELLKDSKISSEKLKEIVEKSLATAKNCANP